MKKKVIVLSLGGSLIIPDQIDIPFLKQFKQIILKNTTKYKFIIVCGGGSLARKYISALTNIKLQSLAGIAATRSNARFMNYFFNLDPKQGIPHTTKAVKEYIKKQKIVFCGALEYKPNQTSDSTSAQLAKEFKTEFINLTNIKGLYTDNPKTNKNSKFIPKITWKEFDKMANKTKFKPGQHFVLDQTASKIILKNKIPTYILGQNMQQLDNLLNQKKFIGTEIQG